MMEGASIFRQPAFLLGKPDLLVAREAVGSALEMSYGACSLVNGVLIDIGISSPLLIAR